MKKQEITIKELKQAVEAASDATGLDIYIDGIGASKCLCVRRPNGVGGWYIGRMGTVDEVYAQLVAILSVAELQS